jgi:flagellar export protein FliJ
MKKFTFRLEVLVKTKEIELDQLRKQLADQLSRLDVIVQRIAVIDGDIARFHDQLRSGLQDGMHSLEMSQNRQSVVELSKDRAGKVREKSAVDAQIASIQEELRRVMGELKGLENLREKHYEEYLTEAKRVAETEIDEFIVGNRTASAG